MPEDFKSRRFISDVVLSLLGAALAIVLFLVEKTPSLTGVLLVALGVVLFHPVTQIPWVKNGGFLRRVVGLGLTALSIVTFGFLVWPKSKEGADTEAISYALFRYSEVLLKSPWIQRGVCVVVGMLFLLLLQRTKKTVDMRNAQNTPAEDKGFLDYKMQAEEGMQKLVPVLGAITEITEEVGRSVDMYTNKLFKSGPASRTRVQVKLVGQLARILYRSSAKLDTECAKQEKVGDSLTEGITGWTTWVSKQDSRSAVALALQKPMETFVQTLEANSAVMQRYLTLIEASRGVSQEMNRAIDAHANSIRRIKHANDKITTCCSNTLILFASFEVR
jgi:hypothetical protein